jgi:hypothetical protein
VEMNETMRAMLQSHYDAYKHAKPVGNGLWYAEIGDSRPMTTEEMQVRMQECIDQIVALGFQPHY